MVFWCACNSHWLPISMPSSLSPVLRRMPILLSWITLLNFQTMTGTLCLPMNLAHLHTDAYKHLKLAVTASCCCISVSVVIFFSISDGRMRQLGPTLSEGQSTADEQPPNLALSQPSHTPGSQSGNKQYRDQLQEGQVDSWVPFCFFVIIFCLY